MPDPQPPNEPQGDVQLHGPAGRPAGPPPTVGQMQADHDRLIQRIAEIIDGRMEDAVVQAAHGERFQSELTRAAVAPAAAAGAAAARTPADTLGFGWAKPIVNLTAAGIMFVMLYQLVSNQQAQSMEMVRGIQGQFTDLVRAIAAQGRSDREMFQSALNVQHEDSQRKWAAIEKNTSAVMAIQGEIKQNRELIRSSTETLAELVKAARGQKPPAEVRDPARVPPDGPRGGAPPWPGWWPAGA